MIVLNCVHAALVQARHSSSLRCVVFSHCLPQILELVPTSPAFITQAVLRHLPHRRMDKDVHLQFLRNTFRLASQPQSASIRDALLLGVIGRLLEVRTAAEPRVKLLNSRLRQVDVEIRYEDLDDLSDGEDDNVNSVRCVPCLPFIRC